MSLEGKVALVTGASRGIGKGIALQLGEAGATVYITGRTINPSTSAAGPGSLKHTADEIEARGGKAIAVACDHTKDQDIEMVFRRIEAEQGRLDVLVNNAYSAVPALYQYYGKPFWEIPENMWDQVNAVGLRNHYICARHAAKFMVKQKSGLIVNISSAGGKFYEFTPTYGIGKAACDRMAADCGLELKPHNVTFISLWPGPVKTELVGHFSAEHASTKVDAASMGETAKLGSEVFGPFEIEESIEFSGKCILALLTEGVKLIERCGKIFTTAEIGKEFNLLDIDEKSLVNGSVLQLKLAQ